MSKKVKYRLCGGTFFTLLSNARLPMLSKSQNYSGESSGLSESELLWGLIRVVKPDIEENPKITPKSLTDGTYNFKICKNWGSNYFQLGDSAVKKSFDERVQNEYSRALSDMCSVVKSFLDVESSTKKDEYLVKALVEVLDKDDYIENGQQFFVCSDGSTMTKQEICSAREITLQSFLLGIWHYVITVVPNNTIGQDTYNEWCPPRNNAKREYVRNLGENSIRDITLKYCEGYKMKTAPITEVSDSQTEQENISKTNQSYQQNVNVANVAQSKNSQDNKNAQSDSEKTSGNVINNIHNGDRYIYMENNNGVINF